MNKNSLSTFSKNKVDLEVDSDEGGEEMNMEGLEYAADNYQGEGEYNQDHDYNSEEFSKGGIQGDLSSFFKKDKAEKKKKGFRAFNLSENLLQAIFKIGYKTPTPIQKRTIPEILSGFNIIANSRTGSGKTAAFLLPVIQRLQTHSEIVGCRCLILSPTRDLALQTLDFCKKLGRGTGLRYALLVGGNQLEGQFEKLAQNPDIIIATPGRVFHHLTEGSLSLTKCEILVMDEADKLFEQGYEEHINTILKNCEHRRQVLLFSATIPKEIVTFMKLGIREYKLITLDSESKIPETLKFHMVCCRNDEKLYALLILLSTVINKKDLTLVFVPTKFHCEYIYEFLKIHKINSVYIHGNQDQDIRDANIDSFRKGKVGLLIVTDVAARGLDIPKLDNVVNFNFPDRPKLFIHRVGRTGRAGREGTVISIVSTDDVPFFYDLKVILGREIRYKCENQLEAEKAKTDPKIISFGHIPKNLISTMKNLKSFEIENNADLETLEKSCKNAHEKAQKFKEKPSKYGIREAKSNPIDSIHPFFLNKDHFTEDEKDKDDFMQKLKTFKPKTNVFEKMEITKGEEELKKFQKQARSYVYKLKKEKEKNQLLDDLENQNDEEKKKGNGMFARQSNKSAVVDSENDEDDESEEEVKKIPKQSQGGKPKFIKPEVTKISKEISSDEEDKDIKNEFISKKRKRGSIRNFKDNPQYVSEVSDPKQVEKLWGKEKPLALEELTLNILPDDIGGKKKEKMVWDPKKKNFVRGIKDNLGNIIKKNEAGVKVKKGEKLDAYKKWSKKNKIKIQQAGEVENKQIVDNASTFFKERRMNKGRNQNQSQGGRGGPMIKLGGAKGGFKNELKNFSQLVKEKKEQFKKNLKGRERTTRKERMNKKMKEAIHKNRKSQVFIRSKGRGGGRGGGKSGGKFKFNKRR